jgi:ADP-heptose:LPS heptosyltransferase
VKILAIRLARFGDIVLLLPALRFLKAQFPNSSLTFLTDQRWLPLAAMCPAIDEVVAIDRLGMRDGKLFDALRGIFRVGKDVRSRHFDVAIDFHGFRETSLIARWSGAPRRMGVQRFDQAYWGWCFNLPPVIEDKAIHVSDMFLRIASGLVPRGSSANSDSPVLVIPNEAQAWGKKNLPVTPYAALYVDGPVKERIWPKERFMETAKHIVDRLQAPVVVLSGADPKWAQAAKSESWEGSREGVHVLFGLSIPQLAAAVGSARILVSNDTGPMHLGPALGVPTLGIFSVGFPLHFRPTGAHDLFVQGKPIEQVKTEEVIEAVDRLWTSAR